MNGWYPYATVAPAPQGNYANGRFGHTIKAVCLHVTDGSYQSAVDWFRDPTSGISAHFLLGKAGQIAQSVSIFDTAYGNGLKYINGVWLNPDDITVHPRWARITPGVNPNFETISIEHEGKSGDIWSPEMDAANTRLLRWISDTTGVTYTPLETLIGHCDLDMASRAYCPGPTVDYWHIAASANLPSGQGNYTVNCVAANVRTGPGRSYPVINKRSLGSPVLGDTWVLGESIGDEARWLHRTGGLGFMHASVITRV